MKIITYSEARSSLKSVLDAVHEDADVGADRRPGTPRATPANALHLANSIAQHKAGKAVRRALVNPE